MPTGTKSNTVKMVTVVTAMDREKVEKLFNPQNTNWKYTQSTEALLSVIQQRKMFHRVLEKRGLWSQIPEVDFCAPNVFF